MTEHDEVAKWLLTQECSSCGVVGDYLINPTVRYSCPLLYWVKCTCGVTRDLYGPGIPLVDHDKGTREVPPPQWAGPPN